MKKKPVERQLDSKVLSDFTKIVAILIPKCNIICFMDAQRTALFFKKKDLPWLPSSLREALRWVSALGPKCPLSGPGFQTTEAGDKCPLSILNLHPNRDVKEDEFC